MPTIDPATNTTVDPADFVSALHAEGNLPQNAGGDPAVPDSSFVDTHIYQQPTV